MLGWNISIPSRIENDTQGSVKSCQLMTPEAETVSGIIYSWHMISDREDLVRRVGREGEKEDVHSCHCCLWGDGTSSKKSTGSGPLRFGLPTIWRWLLRIVNTWGPWSPWFKNQKQKHWINLTIWFLLLIMVVVIMSIHYTSTYYVPVTFLRALHIFTYM